MGDTAAAGGVFIGLGLRGVREIAAATTAGTADAGVPGIGPTHTYKQFITTHTLKAVVGKHGGINHSNATFDHFDALLFSI